LCLLTVAYVDGRYDTFPRSGPGITIVAGLWNCSLRRNEDESVSVTPTYQPCHTISDVNSAYIVPYSIIGMDVLSDGIIQLPKKVSVSLVKSILAYTKKNSDRNPCFAAVPIFCLCWRTGVGGRRLP
jgi:hypothetical protein